MPPRCENIKKIVVEKVKGQSANVPAALTDAYEKANRRLKKSPHDDSLSGTTAICVFSSGRKLYVGNVGDSRAMLGSRIDFDLIELENFKVSNQWLIYTQARPTSGG